MGEKETYQSTVEEELARSDSVIEEFKARVDEARGGTKTEYDEQLNVVFAIQTRARERLQELIEAKGETWHNLKPALDGTLSELRNALANIGFRIQPRTNTPLEDTDD